MVSSHVKDGQVKVLSAWTMERNPIFPKVATAKEEGYGDLFLWTGMAAPAGVPKRSSPLSLRDHRIAQGQAGGGHAG